MKNNKVVLRVFRKSTVKNVRNKIKKAGLSDKMSPLKFLNIRLISSLFLFLIILLLSKRGFIIAPVITFVYFTIYEYLFLDLKIKKRQKTLEGEAIYFFEVLALTIESGRNLKNAIEATTNNVDGYLSAEFKKSLEEVDLGKSLPEALENMKKRIPSDTINNTILNLAQSNIHGNGIVDSLYNQIDFLREQQILEVKSFIAKLPTKISIISVLLFLPIVLLIIIAPIVIKYLLG